MRRMIRFRAPRMAVLTPLAVLVVALLVCAIPAAGQPGSPRPPGVPPPVDWSALPSQQNAARTPFDNSVGGRYEQLRGPQLGPNRACVASADLPPLAVQPSSWGQRRLRFDELRQFATGHGQLVAVIDTGVSPHPRLAGRLHDGGDYLQGATATQDCDGHGTLVAGIIAAADDPATGFTGIAPQAHILSIRQSTAVLQVRLRDLTTGQESERSGAGDTRSLALAVVHAVARGATVINISESACSPALPDQVEGADLQAAVRYATDRNVVVVVAAGNAVPGTACHPPNEPGRVAVLSSPAWFDDDVLAVGAIGEDGEPAGFTLAGPWVDVAAPGTDVVSLDPVPGSAGLTSFTVDERRQPARIQGTSFATPYVAGLAALVRQRFPHLNAREVMRRIELTAVQSPGVDGRHDHLGHGMIDPVAALTAVLPSEHGATPAAPQPGTLGGLTAQPRRDPLPTRVAIIGSGTGLLVLAVTGFLVHVVHRARRRPTPPPT